MRKMMKKGITLMTAAMLALVSAAPVTALTTITAMAIPSDDYPGLIVNNVPKGKIGRSMNITFTIRNDSSETWNDVEVSIEDGYYSMTTPSGTALDGDYVFPFEITDNTFKAKHVGKMEPGDRRNVSLTARVRADLPEGYYTVPIEVGYNESKGNYIGSVTIWLSKPTGNEDDEDPDKQINFTLGEGQGTPYGVYPNVLNYSINMRNSGLSDARDVTVSMVLSKDTNEFPFDINEGNYDRRFELIKAEETVQLPYSMAIRSDAYSGYYPIKFNITYRETATGDLKTEEDTFWVRIKNKDKEDESGDFNANDRTKARIVVDSFETVPKDIIAGEPFLLILRMKNASSGIAASNIMFSLESEKVSESAVFTTESGSSSVVVNSMAAGEVTEIQINMLSKAGIDQRSYALKIKETYDSPEFKNAAEEVSIDIPIKQIARLNTGTIEVMPDSINVGSESNIMFPINNTGKVILYNVMVSFEADSITGTETYVGNIKPGETGNVDTMVSGIAATMDDGKVKIKITYEDENGELQDPVEKELSLYVMEPMPDDFGDDMMTGDFGDVPMEEPSFFQKYLKFIIPAIAVVVAAAASFIIIKRKKKKAAEEEDLDDEIS